MLWLVNAFAALPSIFMRTGIISAGLVWVYYIIAGLAIWLKTSYKKLVNIISSPAGKLISGFSRGGFSLTAIPYKWVVIPLAAIAFLTTFAAATMPDNNLHVSFLDVGEGDSVFIKTGDRSILIDGGPSPQAVCLGLSSKLPFWDKHIDLLVLTHPHLDHLNGLIEVLKRYKVDQVLAPNLISGSPAYREWLKAINVPDIKYSMAQTGQKIDIGNGTVLDILNPPDTVPSDVESDLEDKGIVVRLTRGDISFLFTADIGPDTENRLINERAELTSTVLKVAHHGSSTSTTSDFLAIVRPQIAVISSGSDNLFGHPDEKVLERLKESLGTEKNIYRTDQCGMIEVITDGQRLWVKQEKE